MRRDDLYLNDIIEAAGHIAAFLEETDLEDFLKSELIRSAVVQKLAIIGADIRRTDDPVSQIPWPQIIAFRNILIHAYFGIHWNEVWKAARVDCPALREQVDGILATEFGGSAGGSGN